LKRYPTVRPLIKLQVLVRAEETRIWKEKGGAAGTH